MRTGTIGGFRAAEYEAIAALDSNGYQGRKLYSVDGLPGVFRRVSEPKGVTHEAAGCIQVFFDGSLLTLTPDLDINLELLQGGFRVAEGPQEAVDLVAMLKQNRRAFNSPEKSTTIPPEEQKSDGRVESPTF